MKKQREADSIELRRGTRGKPVVEPLEEDKVTNVNTSDEKAVLWNHWDDTEDLNKNLPSTPPFKTRIKEGVTASSEIKQAIAEETSDEASSKPSYLVVVGGKRKKDETIAVETDAISGENDVGQTNEPLSRKVLSSKKADKEKIKVLTVSTVKRSGKENESAGSSLNVGRMDEQREKACVPDAVGEDCTVKEDRQQNMFLANGVQAEPEANNMVDVMRYKLRSAIPINKENASTHQPSEGGKKHIPTSAITTTVTVKTTVTTKVVRVGDAKRHHHHHHHHHHHRQAPVSIPNATKKSIGLGKDSRSPLQNIAKHQRRSRSTDLKELSGQRHRRSSLSSIPGAGKDDPPIMTKSRSLPTARILWYDIGSEESQEVEDEDETQELRPSIRQELYRDLVIATSPTKRKRGGSLSSSLAEGKAKAYKSGSEVMNDDKLREMEQYAKEGCEYEACDGEEREAESKLEDVEMTEVDECFYDAVETAVPLSDDITNASFGISGVDEQPDEQLNDDGLLVRLLGPLKSSSRNRTGIAWKTLNEIEREDTMVKRVEEDDEAVDWLHRLDMRRVAKALGMA